MLGYSAPVHARITGAELQEHLHSLSEHPDWLPHRASDNRARGFCVTERERRGIDPEGVYEVLVDTSLEPGSLTIAETIVPGTIAEDETVEVPRRPAVGGASQVANSGVLRRISATDLLGGVCRRVVEDHELEVRERPGQDRVERGSRNAAPL